MNLDGRRSMSVGRVSVRAVTAEVAARPGEIAECTLRVRNDGPAPVPLVVRVHGLGQSSPSVPIAGPPVAPGAEVDVEVPLEVPETFGIGAHSLAVEIGSGKPGDRSSLAKVLLTIGAPAGITTRIEPSVVRGGRRTKFDVEVHNSSATRADVTLQSSAPDVRIQLAQRQITVDPGTTVAVRAKVRGPRRWVGDPAQHVLSVEARSGSVPIYATASYRQRALLPRRARGGMIGVAFLALWALIAAAVVLVWARRDDDSNKDATEQVAPGQSLTPLTNPDGSPATGGDGTGGAGGSGGGSDGGAGDAGAAASTAATDTIVRGTVKAGDTGADDGVLVTLTPTVPGETQQVATGSTSGPTAGDQPAALLQPGGPGDGMRVVPAARPSASDAAPTKFWPARYGTYRPGGLDNVRTLSVSSVASGVDGSWQFQQVPLRQSYEVSFAKPGYTTQSFIVSPSDDGKPVELEVELEPGDGALAGTVTGPSGAAQVTVTDGTLTFNTTTSTDADTHGRWAIDSLSTPGTYTVTVTSHGFGTEVMQVHLDAGEERSGLDLDLSPNVGSISGSVTAGGAARGGVTLVATSGEDEITTTSVTEGATGTYSFPQMALGGTYTITASADGYITQTRSVTVDGNTTGVDFALVKSTASIIGRVLSSKEGTTAPLVSAAVTVGAGELQVRTSSAAAPDAGAFSVTDLPPGTYLLAASRYDHPEVSQLVTLTAGQVFDAGDIVLAYQTRPPLTATGSLIVRTVDSNGAELPGATVQLIDVGGTIPTQSKTMAPTESSVSFTAIPISTYTVRVTKANYRPGTIEQLSIGLGAVERQVTMLQYGTARGTVIDAVGGYEYNGDQVYVTADDPSTAILFDRGKPLLLPPESQVGPDARAAYRTVNTDPELFDLLVVEYEGGLFVLDTNNDGVPDQPLTLLRVGSSPLSGYELLLYRMSGANPVCIGPIPETGEEWEIDPTMQLLEGDYVLRFNPLDGEGAGTACAGRGRAPSGYATIPTDGAGNVAAFTVADDLDRKILLNPIQVAPYTQISGRVLVPRIGDPGPPEVVVFDDFDAAQAGGLSVVLDCDAAAGTATAAISPGPGTAVTFTLTREQIQTLLGPTPYDPTTGVIGACYLSASYSASSEFIPVETPVTVAVGLAPPSYPDRTVSVALVDDPGIITGTVWWKDAGATGSEPPAYTIAGATVASDDPVIVGFTPAVEDDPNDPDTSVAPTVTPGEQPVAVSATADAGGAFAFPDPGQRQVLGTEPYTVSGTPFADGTMSITAQAGDWSATGTPPESVVDNGNSVDVFLQPTPGTLNGTVNIVSTRGNASVGELEMALDPPGPEAPPTPLVPNGSGTVSHAPAPAGTWQVDWSIDAGSNLLFTTPTSSRVFVPPAGVGIAPSVSAVELGQIDVNLTMDGTTPIVAQDARVSITQQPVAGSTLPADPWVDRSVAPDSTNGSVRFGRLPVSSAPAPFQDVTYVVSAVVPNHDVPTSSVTVTRINPNGTDGTSYTTPAGSISDIAITIKPGERVRIDMTVPAYATISGRLRGQISHPSLGLPADPLVPGGPIQVVATRTDGSCMPKALPTDPDAACLGAAVGVDGSWSVRVPPGTYEITFAAPDFVSPPAVDLGVLDPEESVSPAEVAGLDQTLLLQTGVYNLAALDRASGVGADPVEAAVVELWWGVYNPLDPPAGPATYTGTTLADATSPANGTVQLPAVYPGNYTLVVRKLVGGEDVNFPVIADIVIPRGPAPTGSTTSHTIAMPAVGGSIAGSVDALASTDRPVAMPAGATVSRTYDLAQLQGSGILPNDATEADLAVPPATSLPLTELSAGVGTTYEFDHLPYGTHELTFSDASAAGYQLSVTNPVEVGVAGDVTDIDAIYRADDVDVVVTVTNSATGLPIAGATVTLATTEAGQAPPPSASASNGVYTFSNVPPDIDEYLLHVEAAGYGTHADELITVAPSASAKAVPVALTQVVKVTGTALLQGAGGVTSAASSVQLVNTDPLVNESYTVTPTPAGAFVFEIVPEDSGPFEVRLASTGYKPVTAVVNAGADVVLGQSYAVGTLTAPKYASATITVTKPGSGTSLDIEPDAAFSGSGTNADPYVIASLDPAVAYTATVSHPNFDDKAVFSNMTPAVGAELSYSVSMNGKLARATIEVTGGASISGLELAVSPSTGVSISGPDSNGRFSVTGLATEVPTTFTLTSDNYQTYTWTYTLSPNENYQPQAIALTPKPATATITVSGMPIAGLALAVTPSAGPAPTVTGPTAGGVFSVTGMIAGNSYSFTITSTNYQDYTIPGGYTATPNGSFTPQPITLTLKPASATIMVNGAPIAGLALTVTGGAASVSGPDGSGIFTVTGLAPGTTYAFKITSTNYEDYTIPGGYTASAGGVFNPGAITLTPKPATASITVTGGAESVAGVTVTSTCTPSNVAGTRTPSTDVWVFSLPAGYSCTFTASATGYTPASTSTAYVATANGTFSATLTPIDNTP